MKYVVVLPAKNEEDNIRSAVESVVRQTVPPQRVLVVDDHSSDRTPGIVKSLAASSPLVEYHRVESSDDYTLGGHVVRVFSAGKRVIDSAGLDYDWIVKMDADVEADADFVEQLAARIEGRRVGIVSGTPYIEEAGRRVYDTSPYWHTHGQFKFYNAACFAEVGGPREHLGWDCADNVRAILAGWECLAIRDVNYRMHREVGGKASNKQGRLNHGIGCYICGFGPGYFLLKVLHDIGKPPVIAGSIALLRGYFGSAIRRQEKVLTKPQRKLLRKLLWSSLWGRFRNRDFAMLQRIGTRKSA